MKLALIRRQFSATGGAELYLQRLMAALVGGGHEVHLFAESWKEAPANVTLHPVAVSGSRAERPVRFAQAVRDALAPQEFDCVFSLERTLKQDVYRAGDGVHRVWLERRRQFAPWWKRPFIGRGAFHRNMLALEAQTFDPANTRRIIVNSNMVKAEILRHFRFPEERIHLVRNGVAVKRFQSGKRAETRARFGVKDDEFLLLFVGSGWERKGLGFVLNALSPGLRDVEIASRGPQIVCDGLAVGGIRLLVVGKGTKPMNWSSDVIFAGSMNDVENAYAAADLFVFLPVYEPSANVVCEALAAGLPVITSAQNGAAELIASGVNGAVVQNPADSATVKDQILHWYQRRSQPCPPVDEAALSLERNVAETVAVLELAVKEKRG